jgi:threonine/homoserine/homoserine lactone efflux protein
VSLDKWLLFSSSISLLISTPGPMAMLLMQYSARYGVRRSLPVILGGNIASILLLGLAVVGVGALAANQQWLLDIIRLCGSFYLIYLGIESFKAGAVKEQSIESETSKQIGCATRFTQGFLVGISNPKDIIFFASFIPQFVESSSSSNAQILLLCVTWAVIDLIIMTTYSFSASQLNSRVTRTVQWLPRISGIVLVGIGLHSLVELSKGYLLSEQR